MKPPPADRSAPLAVLGGGSWGTALARHLAAPRGAVARQWVHDPVLAQTMERTRENATYLPGFALPPSLRCTASLEEALHGASIVVLAVPSHHCRVILGEAAPFIDPRAAFVVASKGIENGSLMRVGEIVAERLGAGGGARISVLSGPSFAREVAASRPTAVVAASIERSLSEAVQSLFSRDALRVYTSGDPVGVELGGALKNVIAIAAGVVEGLGLGPNTLAALMTRGLAEISRLAIALGGRRETISGLAGLGDLVLTCTGSQSRNRRVGIELGSGRSLDQILEGMKMVAEGVRTTRSALDLGRRAGVSMPITQEVHDLLFMGKPPEIAIRELLSRPPRPEED